MDSLFFYLLTCDPHPAPETVVMNDLLKHKYTGVICFKGVNDVNNLQNDVMTSKNKRHNFDTYSSIK
jgi:hypothetical protein